MLQKLFSFLKKDTYIDFSEPDTDSVRYAVQANTSVLDTLLGKGHAVPFSCKSGVCQSCKMQCANPDKLPPQSQNGLSEAEKQLGYFLPCCCTPTESLSISPAQTASKLHSAKVIEKVFVNEQIIKLKIESPFSFKGGQFCNLFKTEELGRSYSIASHADTGHLEFHIKHIPDGQFSGWAAAELNAGDEIQVQGPYGDCIYVETESFSNTPLLMCGIGTGLAPLVGVLKTALAHKHTGNIDLVIAARKSDSFYYTEELINLEQQYSNITLHWLASEITDDNDNSFILGADVYSYTKALLPELDQHHVYLCGAPSFIKKMKKQCFMTGAKMSAIYSDVFQPAQ